MRRTGTKGAAMIKGILAKKIKDCSFQNLTPDLPLLRYGGPIPVFLWGKYADFQWLFNEMQKKGCKSQEDYTTRDHSSRTTASYVLLDNNNYHKEGGGYKQYVPRSWDTLAKSGNFDLTSAPLCGRLLTVSVKGMQALDDIFNNTITFRRHKIAVDNKEYPIAWSYFTPQENLMKYDPHGNTYYPQTHLSLKPARLIVKDGQTMYGATY